MIHRLKIANATIRQIAFDSLGQYVLPLLLACLVLRGKLTRTSNMVISSSDRAIRTFQVSPLTGVLNPIHRFQDLVNRTPWHAVGFSGDGEYVMGGAGHKMAHNVFVWDRDSGVLVKVLEGPKEPLIHCDVSAVIRGRSRWSRADARHSGIRPSRSLRPWPIPARYTCGKRLIRTTGLHLHLASKS